jgi:hypothetical protein
MPPTLPLSTRRSTMLALNAAPSRTAATSGVDVGSCESIESLGKSLSYSGSSGRVTPSMADDRQPTEPVLWKRRTHRADETSITKSSAVASRFRRRSSSSSSSNEGEPAPI